jgi:antitoxin PrlF
MKVAQSRVTAQGQVSVPAEVRRHLGLAPGSILEWKADDDGSIVVTRAHRFSSEEVHNALFPKKEPETHTLSELKAGIAKHMRLKHARR